MRAILRAGLAAALLALSSPAWAASTTYSLSGSWQKIASAGTAVDVQSLGVTALLSTSTGAPVTNNGQALVSGDHRQYTLTADLYALNPGYLGSGGTVVVTDGLGLGPGGAAVALTQTTVTLAAGTSAQLVAANPGRKSLRWMVTGTNPMTVAPVAVAAIVGAGMNYSGGAAVGQQGGSEAFDGSTVPTGAVQAIPAAGTTVTVWEGQ